MHYLFRYSGEESNVKNISNTMALLRPIKDLRFIGAIWDDCVRLLDEAKKYVFSLNVVCEDESLSGGRNEYLDLAKHKVQFLTRLLKLISEIYEELLKEREQAGRLLFEARSEATKALLT